MHRHYFNSLLEFTSTPKSIRFIFSFVIAAVVVGFTIIYRSELIDVLLRVHKRWVGAGLILYGLNYLLRALRLQVIAGKRIDLWPDALYASSLHGFITYLIPLQAGDLSLPIILKSSNSIDLADGSAMLIRTRLLDMMALGGIMIFAAIFSNLSLATIFRFIWIVSGVGLFFLPMILRRIISKKYFQSLRYVRFFNFFAQAGKFRAIESILSFGIWFAVALVFFCVIKAVNLSIGFGGALLLISLQLPLQLLPVQGFANTGNHEGGWVAALILLGVPLAQAAEFAVASHFIVLFYVLSLGIVPLVLAAFRNGQKSFDE